MKKIKTNRRSKENNNKIALALMCALFAVTPFSGCNAVASEESSSAGESSVESSETAVAQDTATDSQPSISTVASADEMFTNNDMDSSYDESKAVKISLNGSSAECDSELVGIDGGVVRISDEGTYILSGALSEGQIVVDAEKTDKIQIVLDNADITSSTSAAIYVRQADKVFITLADGSENSLATSGEYVAIDDNNIDAAVFSKEDLTFNGSGSLSISSAFGHGVVSKDDLVVTDGVYNVSAAGKGFSGKDSVRIAAGSFTVNSEKDGIHAENSDDETSGFVYIAGGKFSITAGTDGISGAVSLEITDGSFDITTGGGSENASMDSNGNERQSWGMWGQNTETTDSTEETTSAKGIKAAGDILISGGDFTIDSSDDALHSNSVAVISGGSFEISSGDDGMHTDSNITISGGSVNIAKSYEGIEGQSIDISGGEISLVSSDDGLNAAGGNDSSAVNGRAGQGMFAADDDCYIDISGGTTRINASGDGIDSNGALNISGGETYVSGPTDSANGALDYGGSAVITGGVFAASGSSSMAQNFGDGSTQGAIMCNLSSSLGAGDEITLTDSSGNVLLSFTPEKQYNSVVISAPGVTDSGTYTLTAGSESQNITMSGFVYGNSGGFAGMGGGRGNRQPDQDMSMPEGAQREKPYGETPPSGEAAAPQGENSQV